MSEEYKDLESGAESSRASGLWTNLMEGMMSCFSCLKTLQVGEYKLSIRRQLAEGGFSFVYEAQHVPTKKMYALKKMLSQSTAQSEMIQKEVRVHKAFRHPNLLPIIADRNFVLPNGNQEFYLLLPLFRRGSLQDYVLKNAETGLAEEDILHMFLGTCKGLEEMHRHDPPWAHRDIKPGNVLLSSEGAPVLMDFGSVERARIEITSRPVALSVQDKAAENSSAQYRAPELWQVPREGVVDEKTDVWSLGAMLFAISFGRGYSPFECELDQSGISRSGYRPTPCTELRILGRIDFPEQNIYSNELIELIRWMLQSKPADRPSVDAVIDRIEHLQKDRRSSGL